jgi:putative DNA primase/helicase
VTSANNDVPPAVAEWINKYAGVFVHGQDAQCRDLLRKIARDGWRLLAIIKAMYPGSYAAAHREVIDALARWANIASIDDDEAQAIIVAAQNLAAAGDGDADTADDDEADERAPEFSDEAVALEFAARHADKLRYVAPWATWSVYNGRRWRKDDRLRAFSLARRLCREVARRCDKPKIAVAIASLKTVAAVERLARADPRLAGTTDMWDADPLLLNTRAGIVDLRTGKLGPHRADAFMTKQTGIAPDGDCPIPTWLGFLNRIMNGDKELIEFLQRVAGYALTGLTVEHALFFCFGTGGNGKDTFLNALIGCWGDYHRVVPIEVFVATQGSRHPTELAGLRGARLVTAVEVEEGRPWAEAKIKWITGGGMITARFMRADFFDFYPNFKALIAGNHKPGLRSVDEAMRRRMNLIPFTVTILPAERDRTLGEKLKAEWPGILAWAIEGCLEWQERGLAPPAAVQAATADYLAAEDTLAAWLTEACEFDGTAWSGSTELYRSWKNYCDRTGEFAGRQKRFSQRIEERAGALGLHKERGPNDRQGFVGLRLRQADLAPVGDDGEARAGGQAGGGEARSRWDVDI